MYSPYTYDVKLRPGARVPWSPDVVQGESKAISNEDIRKKNFEIILNDIHKGQMDWVQMGVGGEGTGKTWVGMRDCAEVDRKFFQQPKDLPQVPFSPQQIKDFIELHRADSFYNGRRGVAILIDEGAAVMSSRSAMTRESRELLTLLTQIRAEFGFFIHINYQSQRLADSWLRNDRAKSLARTYFTFNRMTQTHEVGNVLYYNKTLMNKIRKNPTTGQIEFPASPSFVSKFTPGFEVDFYNRVNQKKYEFYSSAESDKKAKSAKERKINKLTASLTLAKIENDVEKVDKLRKQLRELGVE